MGRKFRKYEGMNPNLKLVRGHRVKMWVWKDCNDWVNRFVRKACHKLPAIDTVYFLSKNRALCTFTCSDKMFVYWVFLCQL